MRLAFHNQSRYPVFVGGYDLYVSRGRNSNTLDFVTYKRVVRAYCDILARKLKEEGSVTLPGNLGLLSAAIFTKKPIYKNGSFVGYGKRDWKTGEYDGKLKAFGIAYFPRHGKNNNLRCYGFVANRRLFKAMKDMYEGYDCPWNAVEFNDNMI